MEEFNDSSFHNNGTVVKGGRVGLGAEKNGILYLDRPDGAWEAFE